MGIRTFAAVGALAAAALSGYACEPSGEEPGRPGATGARATDAGSTDDRPADASNPDAPAGDAGSQEAQAAGDSSFDGGLTGEEWFAPVEAAVFAGNTTSVQAFMASLPVWYRDSYVLMEVSKSIQDSATLQQPRIILFGPDARVLIGIATNPADPEYDVAEVATLDGVTGLWNYRDFNFAQTPPSIGNGAICSSCHGTPTRPIWGTYLAWPGAYGNTGDKLTDPEASQLNTFRDTQTTSVRFQSIPFLSDYAAGSPYDIPARDYPYGLTDFNFALGDSLAMSLFLRMKSSTNYAAFKEPALDLYLCKDSQVSAEKVHAAGALYPDLPGALQLMGLNVTNDFDIAAEVSSDAGTGAVSTDPWDQGNAYLIDLVMLLVANDLLQSDPQHLTNVFAPVLGQDGGVDAGGAASWSESMSYAFLTGMAAYNFEQSANGYLNVRPQSLFPLIQTALCAYLEQ